jgi:protein phosphatase
VPACWIAEQPAVEEQNILLRVLGREPEVEVELNEAGCSLATTLLLCSDGLTRMVPEPTLADAIFQLRDPQRICKFDRHANRNGGADNITVVVVEVPARWWRRTGKRWNDKPSG